MAVSLATIVPGRGRPGDLVTINGGGFSLTPTQNVVTFDGQPAGVNTASAAALLVVVPAGMSVDQHVVVSVTNLDDATTATQRWWSKDTIANTDAMVLRTKIPWIDERLRGLERAVSNMTVAEARFFERVATKIELVRDMLAAKGDFWSRSGESLGARQALAGTLDQPFVSAVDATGGQFQDRECWTLQWGRRLTGATLIDLMEQGAVDSISAALVNTLEVVPISGQVAMLSVREAFSVTSRVIQVELLINGVVVFDASNGDPDFPGPGIRQESITFYPGLRVVAGDTAEVRITRNNITTDCDCLAYALVV